MRRTALGCLFCLAGFAGEGFAFDQGQADQYITTRFTPDDGLPSTVVHDIVQTHDGFLWLTTGSSSLVRFDGRRFTAVPSPPAYVLAVAPDGDLWAGTENGLERISAGALSNFGHLRSVSYHPGLAGTRISALHFSRQGILWVGTSVGLYRFEHGDFAAAVPDLRIERIEEASNGNLLLITPNGFVEWDGSRTTPHFDLAAQLGIDAHSVFDVLEDSRGVTWICTSSGLARRVRGSFEKLQPFGHKGDGVLRAYEDQQGNVWIIKPDGVFRATESGLQLAVPDVKALSICGDRDGNLWIGANGYGLVRLKERAIRMFKTADGLPNNLLMTVLASRDGAIWTGANCGGLSRFDGQRFRTYSEKDGLLNSCVFALAQDANHDLWVGTYGGGAFRFRDGHFAQYSKAQGLVSDIVTSILVARDQSIWMATAESVSNLKDGRIRNYTTAEGLSSDSAKKLYEDRDGGIWVGTAKGIDHLVGDRFVSVRWTGKGHSWPLGGDRTGAIYATVVPTGGLFRIESNRLINVTPDILAADMIETPQGDLWLFGDGIFRAPPGGLGLRSRDDPLDYAVYGRADGLDPPQCGLGFPNAALARDGKLWVATLQGLAMLDTARLERTNRKPAIYMEEITVGRDSRPPGHELVLPPGTHHFELHFDAIEPSSPEKIRFQYRLDGIDPEWLDSVYPAHATYSSIPPGRYSFHIRASNRNGVWDRVGFVYDVTQQPFFYQTALFQVAAAAAGCLLLAWLYRVRLQQASSRLNERLEERLAERERIARELHDTLLQGFQGMMLHFQAVMKKMADQDPARRMMQKALIIGDQVLNEGRDRVADLRSQSVTPADLSQELASYGEQLVKDLPVAFKVTVIGSPQMLHPVVREESYWIAREALENAVRHAEALSIEVEITYHPASFGVRVRDDGRGIAQDILVVGRQGHWGLSGMRERAQNAGARLNIWSNVGTGTEVDLSVPARLAYAQASRVASRLWIKPWVRRAR